MKNTKCIFLPDGSTVLTEWNKDIHLGRVRAHWGIPKREKRGGGGCVEAKRSIVPPSNTQSLSYSRGIFLKMRSGGGGGGGLTD